MGHETTIMDRVLSALSSPILERPKPKAKPQRSWHKWKSGDRLTDASTLPSAGTDTYEVTHTDSNGATLRRVDESGHLYGPTYRVESTEEQAIYAKVRRGRTK